MDKKIILKMQSSKDIVVSIEGGESIIIMKGNRSINADDIYRLIAFSRGDKYEVESFNEENVDASVLNFFEELIKDIIKKLNQISNYDDDEFFINTDTE